MKIFNKIVCTAIMTAMFIAIGGGTSVYSAGIIEVSQSVSENYEQVLAKVKSKITVPENLTEFDINTSQMADGSVRYHFSWNSDDESGYSYSDMSVGADEHGNITSYYYYDNEYLKEDSGMRITDLSKADIRAEIESQLKKIIPDKFNKLEANGDVSTNGYEYSIWYYRIENGLKVQSNYVSVSAIVYDGKVIIRSLSSEWDDVEFEVPETVITEEQAAQIYKDKARFHLNYGTTYKARNEYTAFLRYNFKDRVFIDVTNGEVVDEDNYAILGARNTAAVKEMSVEDGAVMGVDLTPAEQAEIDNLAGLISFSDAEKKIRAIKELGISSDMNIAEKYIIKNGENYIMQLSFSDAEKKKYLYVSINAQNGDLYSANNYSDYDVDSEKVEISIEQKEAAVKKITEFVQKYIPEYYKITAPTEAVTDKQNVQIKFERTANGIPVGNDGISIMWDAVNDKFVSVYTTISNITSIPMAENIIDENSAYERVLKNACFEKMYIMHDEEMIVAYSIVDEDKASVDAFTGEMIDVSGKLINIFNSYSDINGHWSEDIINTLADYNIRKSNGEFKPDECITQKEFLSMLYSAKYSYSQNDEGRLYQQFIMDGILNKADVNPDTFITKQQAVVYLLKSMGHGDVAEIKGIFKCDFSDSSAISENYFGYIAIAKGLNIIKGDESNNFNPEKNITNAEAAVIIYNYLKK